MTLDFAFDTVDENSTNETTEIAIKGCLQIAFL